MKKAVLALLVPTLLVAAASAADEAEYKRWNLTFERGDLGFVKIEDALGNVSLNFYLTFKVTNDTDSDIPLEVKIQAGTDTNQSYRGTIDPLARKALERKTGKKWKSALDVARGSLAPGKSLGAVVFFGTLDPNWDELRVRVAGLYDTIDKVNGKLYFEKKVLVLTYARPGDEFGAADDPITFEGEKWVVEGEREEIPQK